MTFIQPFQNLTGDVPLNRRQALLGLSFLILTACSRTKPAPSAADNVAYFTCTMHPFVRSKDPQGTCPVCGMNLVAVLKSAATSASAVSVAYIDPKRLEEIGAKSEVVTKGATSRSLRIPAAAVLPTGNKSMVFIDLGSGQIEPREVQGSVTADGAFEITSGLKEGERVFVSANFLIDAECRIQGVLKTWGEKS